MPDIDVHSLARDRDEAVIVDVREDDEFAAVRIPGVVHIPMSSFLERESELPPSETYYFLCHSGVRSARVADYLEQSGRGHAVNIDGGIVAWIEAGFAVERGPSAAND